MDILTVAGAAAEADAIEGALRRGGIDFTSEHVDGWPAYERALKKRADEGNPPDAIIANAQLVVQSQMRIAHLAMIFAPRAAFLAVGLSSEASLSGAKEGASLAAGESAYYEQTDWPGSYVPEAEFGNLGSLLSEAVKEAALLPVEEGAFAVADILPSLGMLMHDPFDGINICKYDPLAERRTLLYCNERYVEMSGYSREELESAENLNDLVAIVVPQRFSDFRWKHIGYEIPYRGVSSWRRPDGKENYYRYLAIPWKNGSACYILGIDHDITEEWLSRQKLEQSEDSFRAVIENVRDVVYKVNLDKDQFEYLSPSVENVLGFSSDEVKQVRLDVLGEMVHPDDFERVMLTAEEAAPGAEERRLEFRFRHKDGHYVWISDSRRLIQDPAGYSALVGVFRDISAQKLARRALAESEELFRRLVETSFEGISICRWDPESGARKLLFCNDRFVEMSGYSREELLSAPDLNALVEVKGQMEDAETPDLQQLVFRSDWFIRISGFTREELENTHDLSELIGGAEWLERVKEAVPNGLSEGVPESGVDSWKRPDGKENVHEWTAVSMRVGDEHHLLGFDRDITERVKAEAALRDYATRLERANRELEQTNRDLHEFASGISHDLQAPLRKIHTFSEFLEEDSGVELSEQSRRHLRSIRAAARHMKRLIQHLLSISRIQSRATTSTVTGAQDCAEDAIEVLAEALEACGAELAIENSLPDVMADPVELQQVFQNIIDNALKFRDPDRPPQVTISSQIEGDVVHFAIRDNGIGIAEPYLEQIFGLFKRLFSSDQYEGDGVGLALCERIIRRHGGRIWAQSDLGRGSTFHFTLPAATQGAPQEG
ncbi:MAG: PAS domain S-box protein [Planctomycetes bacterium]|nr:PAS domain S-box protein [Planctomycetota bacterium]